MKRFLAPIKLMRRREDGKLLVGQKANFPADLLVDQEARVKALFDNPVLECLGMACEQPSKKA